MIRSILAALSLSFVLASATAHAKDIDGPPGSNVKVYVPDSWKTDGGAQGSQGLVMAVSPDDKAAMLYAVVEAKNFDAAMQMLDGIVSKVFKDAKIEKGGKVTVNGMAGLAFGATGKAVDDGKPASAVALILQPNATHVLFAIGMAHSDVKSKYKAEFDKALAGIRKQ
jgi:hypothetical protein